jgi:hypothetical protein
VIRFSFAPIAATVAASTTFVDTVHPATNVLLPLRPFLRAYSPNTSAQRFTLDLGSTTALDVVSLIHANFTTATIQGHASDTWGSPSYSAAITLGRSGNDRYHHQHRPTVAVPFNYRFHSLSIPNQATTDGATYIALGVFWPGVIVSPPRDILMDPVVEKAVAFKDNTSSDGRKIGGRLVLDDPAWQITGRRLAETEAELAAWREIDRQFSAAPGQAALVLQRDPRTAETYVMRKTTSKWRHARVWSESDIFLFEVTGG